MILRITHSTTYNYPGPVTWSHNELRLQPYTDASQTCFEFSLSIDPPATVRSFETRWGTVHFFHLIPQHNRLEVRTGATVETHPRASLDGLTVGFDCWDFYRQEEVRMDFAEYLAPTRLIPNDQTAANIAGESRGASGERVSSFLLSLNGFLHQYLEYDPDATHVHTTLREVIASRRGVCQDFTHLMLAVCRSQGIPARYVSGYHLVEYGAPSGNEAMHAWVECLLPDGCWYGLDPTNDTQVAEQHVKVFTGRDYADAAPMRGIYLGGREEAMLVKVRVSQEAQSQATASAQA